MSISDGWMDDVERVPTGEFGYPDMPAYSMWPKAIMSHVMQGYQSTMLQWASDDIQQGKSAHFTIGRDGRIVQHVSIWDPAWHAGDVANPTWSGYVAGTNPNKSVIGIEHEGFSIAPGYPYDYLYSDAGKWPEAMIEATIRVHKWVFEAIRTYDQSVVPGPDTIITHSMTNTLTRPQDPGDLWMSTVRPRIIKAFEIVPVVTPTVVQPVVLTSESFPVPGSSVTFGFGNIYYSDTTSLDTEITPGWKFHNGLDIRAERGTPLLSQLPVPAVVTFAGRDGAGGYTVVMRLPDGTGVIYIHMDAIDVKYGDIVQPGQKIGTNGQTGDSTWPHLHYGRIKAPFNSEAYYFSEQQYMDPSVELDVHVEITPPPQDSQLDLAALRDRLATAQLIIDDVIEDMR